MKYVNIIIPKQDNKYNAELLKNLLPKNVRGQVISLDEYKSQREGNTNDDIAIFIGKDPSNLSQGKVIYPKEHETWGADVISYCVQLDNSKDPYVRITSIGRSALIMCNNSPISRVVAIEIIGKMDAVFKHFGLTVDVKKKQGPWELWDTCRTAGINYLVEAVKGVETAVKGKMGAFNAASVWELIKNTGKESVIVKLPIEYFYKYAVCIFVRDHLEDFLKDSRDVFDDSTSASEFTGSESNEKKTKI